MNNGEKKLVGEMQRIYETYDYDWMGTLITEDNPLTYHHIIRRKKECASLKNGALLTKRSHEKLNKIYIVCPELFDMWQLLFIKINRSNSKISDSDKQVIFEYRDLTSIVLYHKSLNMRKKN